MTVNTTKITSGPYVGNNIADTFSYTFRVSDKSQLSVYETDSAGVETLLTVDTDYTVAGVGNDQGGTITRVAGALPTNYEWYIRSNYQETQLTAFESQGAFFPELHEDAMDKMTFLIQQLGDSIDRTPRLGDSYSGPLPLSLPDPESGLYLRWKNDLTGFENAGVPSIVNPANDFATISDLKAATDVEVGDYLVIDSYTTTNNSGIIFGKIVPAGTGVDDGLKYIDLPGSGLQFQQNLPSKLSVKLAGAEGDGVTDDTPFIQAVYDYAAANQKGIARLEIPVGDGRITSGSKVTIYFPFGKYRLTSSITTGGNIITTGDRAYVFSNTLTFPLFLSSTFNTEWKGLIFDGGTYHIFYGNTNRIEAAVTHVHDCEFRVAYEYCLGDDISVHYNYPMAVHVDNIKSYGSSFACLHNNGTFIKDSWIAWDCAHTGTADNPLFDCSNPFVLDNITEVPFGTNANRTPRIRSIGPEGPHQGRSLSLTCRNVRFGGEATATPIIATTTDDDNDCDIEFIGCSMFGVADFYWAEFNQNLPRRISIKNCQGLERGGFVNCLGMRVAAATGSNQYQYNTFLDVGPDVPDAAIRLISTDVRTGTTVPASANPYDGMFDPEVVQDQSIFLKNEDTGNGFSFFAAPYTQEGTATFDANDDVLGFTFPRYGCADPTANVKVRTGELFPSGGRGVYSCALYVICQNGTTVFNAGVSETGGFAEIITNSGLCSVGVNRITWKFYYDGVNGVKPFFNIRSVASRSKTNINIGALTINKGDTVGAFVPSNSSTVAVVPQIAYGTAAPTDGKWVVGATVINTAPVADGNGFILEKWLCTVAGTPGTWEPIYVRNAKWTV